MRLKDFKTNFFTIDIAEKENCDWTVIEMVKDK